MSANQKYIPLVKAIEAETGQRVHICTALRWCYKRNRFGAQLASWVINGRRMTTIEAVRNYIAASTSTNESHVSITNQSRVQHEIACKELDSLGI